MTNVSKGIGKISAVAEQSPSIVAPKVLGIPELLQAILLEVSSLDLLILQRVNKQFEATIERPIKIRRKLFYKQPARKDGDTAININPLLVDIFKAHSLTYAVGVTHPGTGTTTHPRYCELREDTPSEDLCLPKDGITWMAIDDVDYKFSRSMPRCGSFENMLIADSPILVMFGAY